MIEPELKTLLDIIAPCYAGSLPQSVNSGLVYQLLNREEAQYQEGFGNSSESHFRISIFGTFGQAKRYAKQVKQQMQTTSWQWTHDNEYEVWLQPNDGGDNYFHCIALDFTIWSDEIADETTSAFSSGFLSVAFGA